MSTQSRAVTLAGRRAPPLPIVGALSNWSIGKALVAPAVTYAIIVTPLPFVLTIWYSLLHTIILTVGSVILALVVGLIYAERYPGRGIVRTMFITPFLIMPVVSALTWKNMMLNPVFGVVDHLMQHLHGHPGWAPNVQHQLA